MDTVDRNPEIIYGNCITISNFPLFSLLMQCAKDSNTTNAYSNYGSEN